MRLSAVVGLALLSGRLFGGLALAELPLAPTDTQLDGPLARLDSLGIPYRCATVDDDMNIRVIGDLSKAKASEVQHITIDSGKSSLETIPPLPNEVFDVLPLFPHLSSLRFQSYTIDPQALRRLKEIPKLRRLEMHSTFSRSRKTFSEPADLEFLAELPELESLRLTSCGLTNEMIVKLLHLQSLKRLDLSWNERLTHDILPTLEQLPALEELFMHYTHWDAPKMVERRFAAKLKLLRTSHSYARRHRSEKFTLDEFREIVKLPRHIWGKVHRTDVPLADIVPLLPGPVFSLEFNADGAGGRIELEGEDPSGEPFEFGIGKSLSEDDLATIGQMTELRSLSIQADSPFAKEYQLGFSDAGLAKLTGLANLERLTILVDRYELSSREQPYYLTTRSLAAFSSMPSLTVVVLSPVNFADDSLAWARSTPKLERLELRSGMVSGDALADLAAAPSLRSLSFGYDRGSSASSDSTVSLSRSTKPFFLDNVTSLSLISDHLFVDGMQIVSQMRRLNSLTLKCPLTDTHMRQLASLEHLGHVQLMKPGEADLELTARGIATLRNNRQRLNLSSPGVIGGALEQAMADQFNWFVDWGCGCCGSEGLPGLDWWSTDIRDGRLQSLGDNHQWERLDKKPPATVRIRGPIKVEELLITREDVSPSVDTLCLTDCHIESLHLKGWMPRSIRIWGNSRIQQIVVTDVPDNVETECAFYQLEGEDNLVVPGFEQLSRIVVAENRQLRAIRLTGEFPNLKAMELSGLDNLEYLIAGDIGRAPKLVYPSDRSWVKNLPSLRTLNLAGTAIGSSLPDEPAPGEPEANPADTWFPPEVSHLDLTNTSITDEWLDQLAKLPKLRYLKLSGCAKLTDEAKAEFRRARPTVSVAE